MLQSFTKIKILFILGKQKLIDLMVKVFVTIKILKKSYTESLKTASLKVWESYISPVEIIILVNLSSIKKMEEAYINGQANNQIFMKDSL